MLAKQDISVPRVVPNSGDAHVGVVGNSPARKASPTTLNHRNGHSKKKVITSTWIGNINQHANSYWV